ncbi:hypothetical protein FC43_GL000040 [Limosilactobacillus ingluviei DSM 15946]|uniref:Uncharacterized protein n=1 Tax=Limosilactobacillus ingluviei DSM 15946 TaxID=1423760 RepID=A0A0R1UE50_9LACO|nr:hypothetical protein FC43_GL000040 [Limosilactobacillus ingluviei DSM 15946]
MLCVYFNPRTRRSGCDNQAIDDISDSIEFQSAHPKIRMRHDHDGSIKHVYDLFQSAHPKIRMRLQTMVW